MPQVISPRRTPSRRRLSNTMRKVYAELDGIGRHCGKLRYVGGADGTHSFMKHKERTSVHLNDIVRLPCLVEERFRWAVEAQIREPTFARNGLDPVLFLPLWGLRAEVDVHRAI